MPEQILQQVTIPPNSGMAFEVARGQHLRVSGTTIADFVAFSRQDLRQRFDQARTKAYNLKLFLSSGDKLLTKAQRADADHRRRHLRGAGDARPADGDVQRPALPSGGE